MTDSMRYRYGLVVPVAGNGLLTSLEAFVDHQAAVVPFNQLVNMGLLVFRWVPIPLGA